MARISYERRVYRRMSVPYNADEFRKLAESCEHTNQLARALKSAVGEAETLRDEVESLENDVSQFEDTVYRLEQQAHDARLSAERARSQASAVKEEASMRVMRAEDEARRAKRRR